MAGTMIYILMMMVSVFIIRTGHATGNEYEYDDSLSYSYYHTSCPDMEKIVHDKVKQWLANDTSLAPSIIRLHFHDCVVRGCDGSVLLNHKGSERWAKASATLRGFDLIDEIKAEVERRCPKTVSCSDILTAAARDATVAAGGPYWMVPYGRKDGRASNAHEADRLVPMGRERITDLVELFQSMGLSVLDMVVLSGAHTIGRCNCGSVQKDRLFDQKDGGLEGAFMDPKYLSYLRRKCRWDSDYADLDAVTPEAFDVQYYKNLQRKMGLLYTDQMMYEDSRTAPLVKGFAASESVVFRHQFAASMIKLGNVQDGDGGEVRLVCDRVNAA